MNKSTFYSFWRKLSFTLNGFALFMLFSGAAHAEWNWSQTPSEEEWSAFTNLSPEAKAKEWESLEEKHIGFEDLSWEWRLGWVKACATSSESRCASIIQYGLFDKALIVRAESARILGKRFEGTGHPPALRLLETAFAVQQNRRHKEPLFIQYRILEAIRQIGGPASNRIGMRLAQSSEQTSRYWTVIKD